MKDNTPYNPLDKQNLGKSVANALLAKQPLSLAKLEPFGGAGSYAIYYTGDFEPYAPIAASNKNDLFDLPIYVGKAVPPGAKKGLYGVNVDPKKKLFDRLREHKKSIEQAENLEIEDFACRHLVVDDIWIPLGESLLIAKFAPLWNQVLEGFGNHDPGSGRYKQKRSLWDTLHPGRSWALKCKVRQENQEQIIGKVRTYLAVMR